MLNYLNALKPKLNDVYDSLRPFYIIGHVIGLGYHQVLQSNNGRKYYKIIAWHMLKYILHFLLLIGIYYYFLDQDLLDLTTSNLAHTLSFYGNVLTKCLALINMLIGAIFVKKLIYIVNAIDKVDEKIERLGIAVRHWYVPIVRVDFVWFIDGLYVFLGIFGCKLLLLIPFIFSGYASCSMWIGKYFGSESYLRTISSLLEWLYRIFHLFVSILS